MKFYTITLIVSDKFQDERDLYGKKLAFTKSQLKEEIKRSLTNLNLNVKSVKIAEQE